MIGNVKASVERPAGLDQYGDPIAADPDTHRLSGCTIAPRTSIEPDGRARDGVVVGLTLFCPPGTDIAHGDRVAITEGPYVGTWEVAGETADWRSGLTGWDAGRAVDLTRAQG